MAAGATIEGGEGGPATVSSLRVVPVQTTAQAAQIAQQTSATPGARAKRRPPRARTRPASNTVVMSGTRACALRAGRTPRKVSRARAALRRSAAARSTNGASASASSATP
jgi:hypothetical protein